MQRAEHRRLAAHQAREANWRLWGPYLADRAWGTVREDYSANGDAWTYFPFEHSHQRAYRWNEDGLLGVCDRNQYLCLALGLHNGVDPILKERLFGLTGPQGNHGEDPKEYWFYLDSTPTHSYMKALYKYPQGRFPYEALVQRNAGLPKAAPEFELVDTGIFDENRYFDVFVEYAKAGEDDLLMRITVHNRGPEAAPITGGLLFELLEVEGRKLPTPPRTGKGAPRRKLSRSRIRERRRPCGSLRRVERPDRRPRP